MSLLLLLSLAGWLSNLLEPTGSSDHFSPQSYFIILEKNDFMITQKIVNLANAMAEREGWAPDKHPNAKDGGPSVSFRNHNPGNLRSSIFALGVRDGFAFFYNDATGMFALQFDLMRKAQGKTVTTLTGDSMLAELVKIYACVEDEELNSYVKFVCSRTGFEPTTKLSELLK